MICDHQGILYGRIYQTSGLSTRGSQRAEFVQNAIQRPPPDLCVVHLSCLRVSALVSASGPLDSRICFRVCVLAAAHSNALILARSSAQTLSPNKSIFTGTGLRPSAYLFGRHCPAHKKHYIALIPKPLIAHLYTY